MKNKNYAIRGYSEHIPGKNADTNYGKRFAIVSREQFTRDKYLPQRQTWLFPQRPLSLSPISRNLGKFDGGIEDELHTVPRFHGKSTIPITHPNYTASEWSTNYINTYVKQEDVRPNIFRKKVPVVDREIAKASGFVQNSINFTNFMCCDQFYYF